MWVLYGRDDKASSAKVDTAKTSRGINTTGFSVQGRRNGEYPLVLIVLTNPIGRNVTINQRGRDK